jgi:aminopeptidase N
MTTVSRLIDFFVPEHYDLSLTINEQKHTFDGTVTVNGHAASANQPIKLHAKDLKITAASIDGQDASHEFGDDDELSLAIDNLGAGDHVVKLSFSGTITDHMHGLYPCYYEHDGVKKELFATQFESHHAREVFPCVDEPAAKATFDLHLNTADGQMVLGNMPIKEQANDDGKLKTTFETSPRMSTYLLAFVVGDLQKKSAKTKSGVEVNIWSTPAQPLGALDFPLDIAVRSIEFFDDYFGTPYPLPKSDHVALPDFSSGAMENWGLITYREIALLADPKTTAVSSRHYIATVIAHELSHQWFGNLVTMAWWNDLWLNESFAELMMYLAIDALEPSWNMWLDFNTDISISALRRDAIDGVQAVKVDVNHPDEISTLFDGAIVYAKGGRLLRMIQHYIGDDDFKKGLQSYFKKYAYQNTVGDNLWDELAAASGKQIKTIMNTWITQSGYPVVTLTRENGELQLTQEQFFIGPHEPSTKLWPIPLDADDSGAPKLMDSKSISYPSSRPIRLNLDDSAHFITNYDDVSRQALITKIANGELDVSGRIQLLNEATLLVRGDLMSSDQLLPLIAAYENETSEQVWGIIALALAELRKFVEDNEPAEKKLRQLAAKLAKTQYERLGWNAVKGESEDDTKLRSIIISLTLYGENQDAISKAKELYTTTPLEELDPELRPLIISSVARYGDASVVDSLMKLYKSTQSSEIQNDICVGITSTRVPEKIAELLNNIKNPDIVRPQDVFRWFVYLIRNRDGREPAWQWVRDNWQWVEDTFKGDKSYDDFPRYSAGGLMTRKQFNEYKEFFGPMVKVPALARTITIGISEIEGRVELIERDKDAVQKALLALER